MNPQRGARTYVAVTAFHEAGHALAAIREGRRIILARACHERPGNGLVRHTTCLAPNIYDPRTGPGSALAAWNHVLSMHLAEIRILLAGPLAEAKALNQPLRSLGARSDLTECETIAEILREHWVGVRAYGELPALDTAALIDAERARVRRWLGQPKTWAAITRLAKALSRKAELDETDVARELAAVYSPPRQRPLDFYDSPPRGPYSERDLRFHRTQPMCRHSGRPRFVENSSGQRLVGCDWRYAVVPL